VVERAAIPLDLGLPEVLVVELVIQVIPRRLELTFRDVAAGAVVVHGTMLEVEVEQGPLVLMEQVPRGVLEEQVNHLLFQEVP
jgi:hypothetical protein